MKKQTRGTEELESHTNFTQDSQSCLSNLLSPLLFPSFDQKSQTPPLNDRETHTKLIIQPMLVCLFSSGACKQAEMLTVGFAIDGAPVESHDVLRQGAGLVAEDVFDLAQLLVECGGPRLGRGVVLGVIHLSVPVYEEAVAQTDDLHTDSDTQKRTILLLNLSQHLSLLSDFTVCAETYLT